MTLAEKIKSMTVEQLAGFLDEVSRECSAGGGRGCESCPLGGKGVWFCDSKSIRAKLEEEQE